MFSLAYLSQAVAPFDDAAIQKLAEKSQDKNHRLGITGYLNYHRGRRTFFQFLEGPRGDVRGLMDQIMDDARHDVVKLLVLGESEARFFPQWSMRRLHAEYFRAIEMEDALENLLTAMADKMSDRDAIAKTIMQLAIAVAAARRTARD